MSKRLVMYLVVALILTTYLGFNMITRHNLRSSTNREESVIAFKSNNDVVVDFREYNATSLVAEEYPEDNLIARDFDNSKEGEKKIPDSTDSNTYQGIATATNVIVQRPGLVEQRPHSSTTHPEPKNNNISKIIGDSYIVERGDSLFTISQRSGVSIDSLMALNSTNGQDIFPGQKLIIRSEINPSIPSSVSGKVVSRSQGANDSEAVYWLSRIIHAEAQGEPYIGKVAVGNVILNRVNSPLFPNTIYDVIFDRQYGYVQFSPIADGNINNTPNADSVKAAIEALNGERPVEDALYFLNVDKSTNFWIIHNRVFMTRIGDHDFYY